LGLSVFVNKVNFLHVLGCRRVARRAVSYFPILAWRASSGERELRGFHGDFRDFRFVPAGATSEFRCFLAFREQRTIVFTGVTALFIANSSLFIRADSRHSRFFFG
jgi:hypothetical protein